MTDFQHMLVAGIILTTLWHGLLKHCYYTEKDKERGERIVNKFFFRQKEE